MRYLFLLVLLAASPALAFDGHYAIRGEDAQGPYRGMAVVSPLPQGRHQVQIVIRHAHRLHTAAALLTPQGGDFGLRGTLGDGQGAMDDAGWRVTWTAGGEVVAREHWRPATEIAVAVAAVGAHGPLAGLDARAALHAQQQILARLNEVYGQLGIHFVPYREVPSLVPGQVADRNGDGRLSRAEVEGLRDELERRGIKRPGRVVVAVTQAPFVGHGARGWTLGDAPQTPATLEDLNDNFSLVGAGHLGFGSHTVAHEVGHQFGLDDLGPQNQPSLSEPFREDHLMHSGGEGFHLDPAVLERLERWVACDDNGLGGRRVVEILRPQPASAPRDPGLPKPAFNR